MTSEPMIYGETATSIAAMLEYVQLPNHPLHAQAVEQAQAFILAEHEERVERGRQMMQDQLEYRYAKESSDDHAT